MCTHTHTHTHGLPGCSDGKASACNARNAGLIPGLGRPHGGRHGNPFQYSCLENPMDRGAWWATVHGIAKNRTLLRRLNKQARSITGPCFTSHSPDTVSHKLYLSNLFFLWVLTRRPRSCSHHSFDLHSKKRKPSLAESSNLQ